MSLALNKIFMNQLLKSLMTLRCKGGLAVISGELPGCWLIPIRLRR
jgi:hypothetical protein